MKLLATYILLILSSALIAQEDYKKLAADGEYAFEHQQYSEAISYYDKAIEGGDTLAYSYYLRGLSKFYTKDYSGGIVDLTIALKRSPKDKSRYWYNEKKVNKMGENKYYTAEESISVQHSYFHAYFYRGQAKLFLEDYYGAILDLDKAISYDEEFQYAYYLRGMCKLNLDMLQEAIADYSNEIKINPEHGDSYFYRGLSKISLGLKKEGCLDLSKAGELGVEGAYDNIKEYCK